MKLIPKYPPCLPAPPLPLNAYTFYLKPLLNISMKMELFSNNFEKFNDKEVGVGNERNPDENTGVKDLNEEVARDEKNQNENEDETNEFW